MAISFPLLSLSLSRYEVSGLEQIVCVEPVSPPGVCGQQLPPLTFLESSLGARPSPPAVPSWQLSPSPPLQPRPTATRFRPITSVCAQLFVSSWQNNQSPMWGP